MSEMESKFIEKAKEVKEIIGSICFLNFKFNLVIKNSCLFLYVSCEDTCSVTGDEYTWKGRKWYISPHMTKSEIVQTAFLAVMTATEHEVRENFRYHGEAVFRPHYDVDKLHELSANRAVDVR